MWVTSVRGEFSCTHLCVKGWVTSGLHPSQTMVDHFREQETQGGKTKNNSQDLCNSFPRRLKELDESQGERLKY